MFSYFYRKTIAIIGNTDLFIFCSVISMHTYFCGSNSRACLQRLNHGFDSQECMKW